MIEQKLILFGIETKIDKQVNPEWVIPDYVEELETVKKLIRTCKKELDNNIIEAIPHFNEIIDRELDDIADILKKIEKF